MKIHTIGIDLGKTNVHLLGLNERGRLSCATSSRERSCSASLPTGKVHLIGMEACGGSHFLGRALFPRSRKVQSFVTPCRWLPELASARSKPQRSSAQHRCEAAIQAGGKPGHCESPSIQDLLVGSSGLLRRRISPCFSK
jgi:hypothetical protein